MKRLIDWVQKHPFLALAAIWWWEQARLDEYQERERLHERQEQERDRRCDP